MKKLFTFIAISLLAQAVMAGGILTNSNQSAQFVRMLSRNASLQIDGVYYNPAGLMSLENGWHFSLNNQSIFQTKIVDSKFPWLNNGHYEGDVKAPVFPSGYAVYKMDKLAFSLGFGPVGGGGSATFERGLPSFEIPLTKLVPGMAGLRQLPSPLNYNVSGYDAKLYFDGSSIFWGIQAGVTYKINDVFSVYGGVRYLPSTNTYSGSIQNIQLKVNNQLQSAKTFLTTASSQIATLASTATAGATQLTATASSLQPIITGGGGTLTIAQAEAAKIINATIRAQLEGGLQQLGLSSAQISAMNIGQVQGTFTTAAATYSGQATQLNATAAKLAGTGAAMGDKKVDTKQTGAGLTKILGANINIGEKLNIGIKYEFKTTLELTNSTSVDDLGLFPDGGKSNSDLPAILAVGVGFKPNKLIEGQLSYNLYFG